MLADALEDKFDIIIFHKIDRNSRNELNYYTTKDKLEKLGKERHDYGFNPPSKQHLNELVQLFNQNGYNNTKIGG